MFVAFFPVVGVPLLGAGNEYTSLFAGFIQDFLDFGDVGIGIGMLVGGYIAEVSSLSYGYLFGALLTLISLLYYHRVVAPHFLKNKLR